MDRLKDKVAMVTGSDSGIGQAIAEEFARQGADVAITWLHHRNGAEETRRRVGAAQRRASVTQVDVGNPDDVLRWFTEVRQELGVPYVLVNCAAINATGEALADLSCETWDRTIRTNLYGAFHCCQQFIRVRRAAGGGGKILNVTSVHEEIPSTGGAAYDASKGGLRNLTRSLALELAPDRINVNNIAPGMILTPMNQAAIDDPQVLARQVANVPWKRAGDPREVALLASYLASAEADYATGQSFTLDGGLSINVGQGA